MNDPRRAGGPLAGQRRRNAPETTPAAARSEAPDPTEIVALRAIVEGTAQSVGDAFFRSLVRHLASAMGVNYAFVAEFDRPTMRARTLAYWGKGSIQDNIEFDLAGTPCEDVIRSGLCHHPQGVRERFPNDRDLVQLGIESYLRVPLLDVDGTVLGHLAVFDERPLPPEPRRLSIFRFFATRAAVELERLRVEKQLVESERRYRDLYEEAPNAYVAIGTDRRLVSVNHRATQLLGATAPELVDRPVLEFVAETPAGRARAEEALRVSFTGEEVSRSEWEMRRRDGRALWVRVWMKPLRGPDGRVAAVHSIWVDVTDRVLAEAERARLQEQNLYLQEEIKSVHNFEEIVGRSPALPAVLDKVSRVAATTRPCSSPASEPGDRGSPVRLSMAGESPRAGERARASHHPRDRSGPRFRDRWRTPSRSRHGRGHSPLVTGRRRATPYPRHPRTDRLDHRGSARRRRDPRAPSQYAPQPIEEARDRSVLPRSLVATHHISWRRAVGPGTRRPLPAWAHLRNSLIGRVLRPIFSRIAGSAPAVQYSR